MFSLSCTMIVEYGLTESIFPLLEQKINENENHEEIINHFLSKKCINRYRTIIDLLFCEMFEEYKIKCAKY